jgi:hypothetical protein
MRPDDATRAGCMLGGAAQHTAAVSSWLALIFRVTGKHISALVATARYALMNRKRHKKFSINSTFLMAVPKLVPNTHSFATPQQAELRQPCWADAAGSRPCCIDVLASYLTRVLQARGVRQWALSTSC